MLLMLFVVLFARRCVKLLVCVRLALRMCWFVGLFRCLYVGSLFVYVFIRLCVFVGLCVCACV